MEEAHLLNSPKPSSAHTGELTEKFSQVSIEQRMKRKNTVEGNTTLIAYIYNLCVMENTVNNQNENGDSFICREILNQEKS